MPADLHTLCSCVRKSEDCAVRGGSTGRPSSKGRAAGRFLRAFTLIELMIVIGIMGIVMAIGVPIAYKVRNRGPMNQGVRDVVEVLSNARARAILQGTKTELHLHPKERRMQIAGGGATAEQRPEGSHTLDSEGQQPAPERSGLSAQLSDRLTIEMCDVNLIEYKDQEFARVTFYPNGTCDEFTLILHSDKGEWMKIWTEATTGLANVGQPTDR